MLIEPLPFRIGRQPVLELVLPSHRVSKIHAEIHEADGKLPFATSIAATAPT